MAAFACSAICLTLMQAPHDLSFLAWIAWVPFMLACGPEQRTRPLLVAAYMVGLVYWLCNLYWLWQVTAPGYVIFSMIFGIYWPLLALAVQFVRRKGWPLFVAAPVIFVGAEAWQGYLFTGFQWYFLGHSQYAHLQLIQISDVFGALGVSALIAIINGFVADSVFAFRKKTLFRYVHLAGLSIACFLLVLVWSYGGRRLAESRTLETEGPLLGSVQPNVPTSVKEEISNGPQILNNLIADSEQCVKAGAALVAWPETMVLAPMNQGYIDYLESDAPAIRYQRQIMEHAKDRAYILFGAPGADVGIRQGEYDVTNQYNSAFLYQPDGTEAAKRYDKMHLVPFGEYVPFSKTAPWIYRAIMWLTPYDYDYNLTAGTEHTLFSMRSGDKTYAFAVLICYEDTDATVTRKHVVQAGQKRADWLVNLSNDGWYVRYKDGKVLPSVELAQRTAISVFRAIENRVSILRSVNTGISCLIEPTGHIRDGYRAGTLPPEAMERQGVAGWFVDAIPIDSRVTFFGRHGRWLDIVLGIGLAIILGLAVRNYLGRIYSKENQI
ncbi:MAG: apolipoprotein N-acyltransferase [Planctomycetaceae bacterium]|nr:apolipoprotein N-acyltransferase [Planctomycetaceae bacterium]